MRYIYILLFIAPLANVCSGQDYLLSQRGNLVQLINPAKVGIMETDYRAGLAYRNQWSTISKAYVTSAAHFDMPVLKKNTGGHYLGVGLLIVRDKAGKSKMGTFEAKGSLAAHLALNDYNRLSTGLLIGYSQRSINLKGLAWDNQYNGVGYDPSLSHGEDIQRQKEGFFDAGIGVEWAHKRKTNYTLSYALFHYGQNQSMLGSKDKLFMRHVFQADWQVKIKALTWDFELVSQVQSAALEVVVGAKTRYRLGLDSRYTDNMTSSGIMAGLYYRYNDAIIPMLGYEYKRLITAWFSYDINVSRLQVASASHGAWEIHILHTGFLKKRRVKLR